MSEILKKYEEKFGKGADVVLLDEGQEELFEEIYTKYGDDVVTIAHILAEREGFALDLDNCSGSDYLIKGVAIISKFM